MSARRSNLKNRVANYTHPGRLPNRLRRMVAETRAMEVVITHTEVEALLLESNLIKRLMPRYNVLLRDDKSFPYIHLTGDQRFPQITKHRGATREAGDYFGPFASAGRGQPHPLALQRAFLLRSCCDSVFASRTRPCLLYQIKRCSAPCVGRIDKEGYAGWSSEARAFLSGRSQDVQARAGRAACRSSRRAGFRGRGAAPRPHPRADPDPGPPGHQRARSRRCRRDRRASGRRPHLRPGLLLPRRPELGQPRLFPEP